MALPTLTPGFDLGDGFCDGGGTWALHSKRFRPKGKQPRFQSDFSPLGGRALRPTHGGGGSGGWLELLHMDSLPMMWATRGPGYLLMARSGKSGGMTLALLMVDVVMDKAMRK